MGGEAELQLPGEPMRFRRREGRIERTALVGVEMVADHDDAVRLREILIDQGVHGMREVALSTALADADLAPAEMGGDREEEIGTPLAAVLRVLPARMVSGHRRRGGARWPATPCRLRRSRPVAPAGRGGAA